MASCPVAQEDVLQLPPETLDCRGGNKFFYSFDGAGVDAGDMDMAPLRLSHPFATYQLANSHRPATPLHSTPHNTFRTDVQAAAARPNCKMKMSASEKMNLPHVAIYYANIINIIYRCQGLSFSRSLSFSFDSRWGGSIPRWLVEFLETSFCDSLRNASSLSPSLSLILKLIAAREQKLLRTKNI